MNSRRRRIGLAGFVVLAVTICFVWSCTPAMTDSVSRPDETYQPIGMDQEHGFSRRVIPELDGTFAFLKGDLLGNADLEIVAVAPDFFAILNLEGEIIQKIVVDDLTLNPGIVGDVDGDGKAEVVFGARGDRGARIVAFNGRGNRILEIAEVSMVLGTTTPWLIDRDRLFFSAVSDYRISPKIVGSVSLTSGDLEWTVTLGPVPTGISIIPGSDMLMVTAEAAMSEHPSWSDPVLFDRLEHRVIFLDPATGSVISSFKVGDTHTKLAMPTTTYSSIRALAVPARDGSASRIMISGDRMSDLYDGPAVVSLTDLDGAETARLTGPARTAVQTVLLDSEDRTELLIGWERSGRLTRTDADLAILHQTQLPGSVHQARIQDHADLDGDGEVEILVTDLDRMVVLSQDLTIESGCLFPSDIRDLIIAPLRDQSGLAVAADHVYWLTREPGVGGDIKVVTRPAGATLLLDGDVLDVRGSQNLIDVTPGTHTLQAGVSGTLSPAMEVTVQSGQTRDVELIVPLTAKNAPTARVRGHREPQVVTPRQPIDPGDLRLIGETDETQGLSLVGIGDFLGDEGLEIALLSSPTGTMSIFSDELELLTRFQIDPDVERRGTMATGDLDGDGKSDFITTWPGSFLGFSAHTGDGRRLSRVPLLYGHDSRVAVGQTPGFGYHQGPDDSPETAFSFVVNSGYMMRPRALVPVDPINGEVFFYHPTAAAPLWVVSRKDAYLTANYTPVNGAVIDQQEFGMETDGAYFVHLVDSHGNLLPGSGELPDKENRGGIAAYAIDMDLDGVEEFFLSENKDPNYNPGVSKIWQVGPGMEPELMVSGYPNTRPGIYSANPAVHDGARLVVMWQTAGRMDLYDSEFGLLGQIPLPVDTTARAIWDINRDGEFEFLITTDDGSILVDAVDGEPRWRPDPPFTAGTIQLADLDQDGFDEIVVYSGEGLRVYSDR